MEVFPEAFLAVSQEAFTLADVLARSAYTHLPSALEGWEPDSEALCCHIDDTIPFHIRTWASEVDSINDMYDLHDDENCDTSQTHLCLHSNNVIVF